MKTRDAINAGMMLAVAAAMLGAVVASMRHSAESAVERERCYRIARVGQNDCANAVHSCAQQAKVDSDPREWLAVPNGTCKRLAGGVTDEHAP